MSVETSTISTTGVIKRQCELFGDSEGFDKMKGEGVCGRS